MIFDFSKILYYISAVEIWNYKNIISKFSTNKDKDMIFLDKLTEKDSSVKLAYKQFNDEIIFCIMNSTYDEIYTMVRKTNSSRYNDMVFEHHGVLTGTKQFSLWDRVLKKDIKVDSEITEEEYFFLQFEHSIIDYKTFNSVNNYNKQIKKYLELHNYTNIFSIDNIDNIEMKLFNFIPNSEVISEIELLLLNTGPKFSETVNNAEIYNEQSFKQLYTI